MRAHPIASRLVLAALLSLPFATRANASTATLLAGQAAVLSVSAEGTAPFSYQWYKNGAAITGATSATLSFASLTSSDAGSYQAVVQNSAGSATSDLASLTVTSPTSAPVFTTQPVSLTVREGDSFKFTASATGSPTFQWRKDGVPIPGATYASYSVSMAALSNAGVYTVVATNSGGSTISSAATLTVTTTSIAPTFTTQPVSKTVTEGQSVTFSAAASGSPSPAYQWRKDGVAISGATGSSYAISSATLSSAGTYTVVATNSAGSATSSGAVLTVNAAATPPVFTVQPVGMAVNEGEPVVLSAAATGSPMPTYQWRLNGSAISGATGSSYSVAVADASDAGTYTVVATNSAGSATSQAAVVTVNAVGEAPAFVIQPVSTMTGTGGSARFTAVASGSPEPAYQWRRNGTPIAGATGASYVISSATTGSAGTYTVVATNSAGSATSTAASLTVRSWGYPYILAQPTSQSVANGAPVTFRVNAGGSSRYSYQWRRNGSNIRGATGSSYTIGSTSSGSAGAYSVVIKGSKSSITSANAVLTVLSAPRKATEYVDFNRDGQTDLLWQDEIGGDRSIGYMAGVGMGSDQSLGTVGVDWNIVGSGDFNRDDKSDIVWHNQVTGECSVWLMSGSIRSSSVVIATRPVAWEAVAVGDFDGDGNSDIVWQNVSTGSRCIDLMNGTSVSSTVYFGVFSVEWTIVGAGDFTGDGKPDLVWQNELTGERSIMTMWGVWSGSSASLGRIASEWEIAGAGDFDGDGKPDLAWENRSTGERFITVVSALQFRATASLGIVSPEWSIRN